jgi:hypothetical protein
VHQRLLSVADARRFVPGIAQAGQILDMFWWFEDHGFGAPFQVFGGITDDPRGTQRATNAGIVVKVVLLFCDSGIEAGREQHGSDEGNKLLAIVGMHERTVAIHR